MNYLDDISMAIESEVPREVLPAGDSRHLFRLYALLVLAKGQEVSAKDVHNAWVVWMTEQDPTHESIKPFEELSSDMRREDQPFVDAIRAVAGRREF